MKVMPISTAAVVTAESLLLREGNNITIRMGHSILLSHSTTLVGLTSTVKIDNILIPLICHF